MKSLFSFLLPCVCLTMTVAQASELTALLGRPDASVDFVRAMILDRIAVNGGALEVEESTRMYSVLAREGVRATTSVELIPEGGSLGYAELMRAVQLSWAHAPVVLDVVGPTPDWLCAEMNRHPNTLYVLAAGAEALDTPPPGACRSATLLYVAAMDASENLASFSNRGDWVVLAAPGVKVPTLGRDRQVAERSGTSWAAAAVAGRLATFATHHPSLRGAPLAAEFLLRETHASQGLEGQVQAARALNELPSR